MNNYKELEKQYSPSELAESFVFPGATNEKQREGQLQAFREFRKGAAAKLTEKDKLILVLLQLKFQMEDYILKEPFSSTYHFGFFLKEYISRLNKRNKDFAEEISIDPTELSLIINRHRPPTEKLIIRLEIHSNKNFPAVLWFRLMEKEREHELMHDTELRSKESKHVKHKLEFSLL
jgi:plasmid maintenance system antidote protein VapI